MAGKVWLEHTTHRLTADCSDQLSYIPISYTLIIPHFFTFVKCFLLFFWWKGFMIKAQNPIVIKKPVTRERYTLSPVLTYELFIQAVLLLLTFGFLWSNQDSHLTCKGHAYPFTGTMLTPYNRHYRSSHAVSSYSTHAWRYVGKLSD